MKYRIRRKLSIKSYAHKRGDIRSWKSVKQKKRSRKSFIRFTIRRK